jgi:hypothetical protein
MRKTLIYVVLLALVGAAVYYFFFAEKSTFGAGEADFAIKDSADVHKIFLADKKGQTVTLERDEKGGWTVNKEYKALSTPVISLLSTLMRQTATTPVPEAGHNHVIKMLAGNSVKVEVYNRRDKKMRVFYVGGEAHDNAGTYMLMEGADKPYIVQMPGFTGYIAPRYSAVLADWRDRTVFNIPAEQLKTASVQYADSNETLNSFTFRQDDKGKMTIDAEPALIAGKKLNERRTQVFSTFFEKIYCEGFINGTMKLDSIIASVPKRCVIEVESKAGEKQKVDVYWMPVNRRSKNLLTPNPDVDDAYDADRFYAVGNNAKDTMIIQRGTFEKIFRKAYEFYEEDKAREPLRMEVPKGSGDVIKMGSGK